MHPAHIDRFAFQDSWIHRLDSRVKIVIAFLFTVAVIALPLHAPAILFVAMLGPFAILVLAAIPLRFAARHLLWAAPFMTALALSCIWFDRAPARLVLGPWVWQTTAGWIRALTILGKYIVTMTALIALVSTTRFNDLLVGLQRMRVPQILILQLGFLYRYLFVLIDTAGHLLRARRSRSLRRLALRRELAVGTAMLGSLLARSLDRAETIHRAMQIRGFHGTWPQAAISPLHGNDVLFLVIGLGYLTGLLLSVPLMSWGGGHL